MSIRTEQAKKSSRLERKSRSPTQAVRRERVAALPVEPVGVDAVEDLRTKRHGDSYGDVQRERDAEEAVGTPAHAGQDRGPEEPSEEPVGTNERLEGDDT
jgi:hypothetical protein